MKEIYLQSSKTNNLENTIISSAINIPPGLVRKKKNQFKRDSYEKGRNMKIQMTDEC